MNKAQKRTWQKILVSIAGLLFMAGAIAVMKIKNLDFSDKSDQSMIRILGLINTIPLILMVIIDWGWKKVFDERDKLIAQKANYIGIIGTFIFLAVASEFLIVITKIGSIKTPLITSLVYLACFVWILVSSIAALMQYSSGCKGEKS